MPRAPAASASRGDPTGAEPTAMTTSSASARQGCAFLPPPERGEAAAARKSFSSPLREPGRASRGLGARSHTATPTTSAITGVPAVSRRRTDPEAAGGSPWPPAGHSVTVSARHRCWNVVVGIPMGFWKEQGHSRAFTAKPGAPHNPPSPSEPCPCAGGLSPREFFPGQFIPAAPPGQLPPASLISARLWF